MSKIITTCVLNNIEYRLKGGQPNGMQISYQGRHYKEDESNLERFVELKDKPVRIMEIRGELFLCTNFGYKIIPSPSQWPEWFLKKHLEKLKSSANESE